MQQELSQEIAAAAARLVVEEGLDYGAAKRRAVKELGAPARAALPDNDAVQEQVRAYLALFRADTQPAELLALRELALAWMQRLAEFRPHLTGAVWNGTATRLSDVYLQLFCDDPKSAEIALINQGVAFEARQVRGFRGEMVDALSFSVFCSGLGEHVGVHLMIHDHDDVRGALKPAADGRPARGDEQALRARMLENAASTMN
ncbi:hypothetical protein ADJ79_12560 [Ottowia sp. oral taxon 894]|uniref:hypothetical protein n=1 Tax=Ottowia sp. oral taxon 894 TaxID=1658672 RepID=UPI000682B2D5|nr:hypothetical protein [Ottowia sp. oral taxon 894]AKU68295.1 hypothetical protein ADJ79_12560 [Ottowia sp. oral taxon 894]